jgi:hypothetical protein
MVVHACNSTTWESESGGSQVQVQSELHSKFKASLGYIVTLFLKQTNKQKPKCFLWTMYWYAYFQTTNVLFFEGPLN